MKLLFVIFQIRPIFFWKYTYIYIHIPRDDKLCEEDVDTSFAEVENVIKRYYPELQNEKLAYYTESWLLSPELCQILDDNSNIIRFQQKFHIVGEEANVNDFLNFVLIFHLEFLIIKICPIILGYREDLNRF